MHIGIETEKEKTRAKKQSPVRLIFFTLGTKPVFCYVWAVSWLDPNRICFLHYKKITKVIFFYIAVRDNLITQFSSLNLIKKTAPKLPENTPNDPFNAYPD